MSEFQELNIPATKLKITKKSIKPDETVYYVWDEFRNKRIKLTPEEWVRQHFLHYLVRDYAYPKGFIGVELGINVNRLNRRCDAVVFDETGLPLMIIECKAPNVPLTEKTLHQVASYNFKLQVNWLLLTNGLQTVVCYINAMENSIDFLEEIPSYNEIKATSF